MPKSQSSIDSEETLFEELSNPTRPISNPPDVLPTSDTLLTGNILLTLNGPAGDRKLFFTRLLPKAEDLQETNWTVNLPFYGWSVAMHPPANVLAMSQNTGSTSYVISWRFFNPGCAPLTISTHVQGHSDSYFENGQRRESPLSKPFTLKTQLVESELVESVSWNSWPQYVHQSKHCRSSVPRIKIRKYRRQRQIGCVELEDRVNGLCRFLLPPHDYLHAHFLSLEWDRYVLRDHNFGQ